MICKDCAQRAAWNRDILDRSYEGEIVPFHNHPNDCGCDCQHADPDDWEAMYAVERPSGD